MKAESTSEPEDMRREPRLPCAGSSVVIKGEKYPLLDWSSSAFCAGSFSSVVSLYDRIDVNLSLSLPENPLQFGCQAIIVRVDTKGEKLACVFVRLSETVRVALEAYFQDSGEDEAPPVKE